MAFASPGNASTGPLASSDDRPGAPRSESSLVARFQTFFVCAAAVVLVTAVLFAMVLVRLQTAVSSTTGVSIGYAVLVVGGALVVLSVALAVHGSVTRSQRTAAWPSASPAHGTHGRNGSNGLRIATRVEPRPSMRRTEPARRATHYGQLAAARRPAQRQVVANAVVPRSAARLAAPRLTGPALTQPTRLTIASPRSAYPTWHGGRPRVAHLFDRTLGRLPEPFAHS